MKWVFLTVLVIVAGAVAGFAIYTFGWHNKSRRTSLAPTPEGCSIYRDSDATIGVTGRRANLVCGELIRALSGPDGSWTRSTPSFFSPLDAACALHRHGAEADVSIASGTDKRALCNSLARRGWAFGGLPSG